MHIHIMEMNLVHSKYLYLPTYLPRELASLPRATT